MKNLLHNLSATITAFSAGSAEKAGLKNQGSFLEIFIPREWPGNEKIFWCKRRGTEVVDKGEASDLSSVPFDQNDKKIIIWSPSADTLLIEAELPTKSRSKINQALPFVLEDKLLQPPEKEHFVYQSRAGLPLAVSATSREKLDKWLAAFHESGLQPPTALYPQVAGLPLEDNYLSMAILGNELLIKVDQFAGFSCVIRGNELPVQLVNFLKNMDPDRKPAAITYYRTNDKPDISNWSEALGLQIIIRDTDFWSLFQVGSARLNILQGAYKQKREINPALTRFYPAAALLAVWITFSLLINIWEWQSLKSSLKESNRQMTQVFKASFPDARTIVDPALQMQRKFDELSGSSGGYMESDFLALLIKCVPALSALEPGAIENLRYNEKSLDISLGLPDFKSLESLKEKLSSVGMRVEVVAANSRSNGVEGRLKVSVN